MSFEPAISLVAVSKHYRTYPSAVERLKELLFRESRHSVFSALKATELSIGRGEVVGILGRNGAGKSTLLQIIAGTLTPSTGAVQVDGKVAALLELGSGFNPDFTGRENVFLYGFIMGMTRQEVSERLEDILSFADIGAFIDKPLRTYSSGMSVRLAFSTIAHLDPDILLVDEALAVGDAQFQMKCLQRINSLKAKGKTFILVSHSVDQIISFCTRALVMEQGEVVFDGTPKEAGHIYKALLFPGGREVARKKIRDIKETGPAGRADDLTAKSEFRYGNRDATIDQVKIVDKEGESLTVAGTNENVTLRFCVSSKRLVAQPVYGVRVRNLRGTDVYVKNTMQDRVQPPPLRPGRSQLVSIPLTVSLVGGEYFVSVSITESTKGEQVVLDRRMDVLQLSIVSGDGAGGIANLNGSFEVEALEEVKGKSAPV